MSTASTSNNSSLEKAEVFAFFDKDSSTFSYVVKDPQSQSCAVIDSVLDFDYPSGTVSYEGAERIIECIQSRHLSLEWIIETHVHADHLSAAPYIKEKLGGKIAISANITLIQKVFGEIFNEGSGFLRDGSQFDYLFQDGEQYRVGGLTATAILTPGHTPACMTHVIGDAAFLGDTLFMPDGGTARADFPGGDARTLYRSIQKLMTDLAPKTRLFMCHDYCPNDRELENETTIAAQIESNIHVRNGITEDQFVKQREERDSTLDMPRLILPSLQVNMRAGDFPDPEDNDCIYLKLPINAFS